MGLPSPYKPSRFISPLRARQLHRALKNLKLSMICGLLTILVLRGALGAGKFGTPAKDFEELKLQFERVHSLRARKHASRVLAEVVEERNRPLEGIATVQAAHAQVQRNADLQGNYAVSDGNLDVRSSKLYALSPKLSDGDVQRRAWLRVNPNYVASKPKIILVTAFRPSACPSPTEDASLLKNKVDYCKLHGIRILHNLASLDAELSGFSAKLRFVRTLMLSHPEVEWFWWMDSDALFSDMAVELPVEQYENYNVVFHGWDGMIYKQNNGASGITSGSFLIRNCQWALNMLDTKAPIEPEPKSRASVEVAKLLAENLSGRSNSDEQPMIVQLLMNEEGNLKEKLPVEEPLYVHGYWKIQTQISEEGMKKNHDDVGEDTSSQPFVTRFVRHDRLCEKGAQVSDYIADLHLKDMERRFDITDSQVLQRNGDRHKSLSSSTLQQRFRGRSRGSIMESHSDFRHYLPADQSSKHISRSSA